MTLYNILDRYIFLPIGDIVYGSSVVAEWRRMRQNDCLSEDELKRIQDAKLQKLVRHCYETVPYYTRLFDSLGIKPEQIRTKEDLKVLPVLTKQIIRDHYNEFLSSSIDPKRLRQKSTGGSTGTPLKFCTDTKEWSTWKASTLRAWGWYGLNIGDKIFSLGGSSINRRDQLFSFKGLYDSIIMRNYKYSSADVSDECMQRHYESMMKLKPAAIRGYGSSLYILARYIEKKKLPVCPIRVVLTTGEVLVPDYRRKLQEVFQAPVYDAYGAADGGILSHECPKHEGLHITEESCIIEITDNNGVPLQDGEIGQVCTTDLDNYTFPFLRYLVGDMAYMKKEKCSCGRSSHLIGEVLGRNGRLVYNKQGVPISPTMLPMMLYPQMDYHKAENQKLYYKIDKFQIRQDLAGDIHILIKLLDSNEPKEQFNYIIDNYKAHFVGSEVTMEFVDEIPCMPSGKEDYCVSEYKI